MKLFQSFLLAATLSEGQRAKKRQVLKSKLVYGKFRATFAERCLDFESKF